MTMMKKTVLSAAAIAVMTGLVGCGDSDSGTSPGTADKEGPVVAAENGLVPADGATDQSNKMTLKLTLSDKSGVEKGTGKIIIKNEDGSTFEEIDVAGDRVTVNGLTFTIDPEKDFELGKKYKVEIAEGVFKDKKGNAFGGISGDAWDFTIANEEIVVGDYETLSDSTWTHSKVKIELDKADSSIALTLDRGAQPNKDTWPYASAHRMLAEKANLSKLQTVIIGYQVENDKGDTVSLRILEGYNLDFGKLNDNYEGYNYFHAVLTKGLEGKGTVVYDTLSLSDFFISWAAPNYKDGTTLASAEAKDFLGKANAMSFQVENGDTTNGLVNAYKLGLKIKELKLIGTGLGTDLGGTVADTFWVVGKDGWTAMGL